MGKGSQPFLGKWWSKQPVEIRAAVISFAGVFITALCGLVGAFGPTVLEIIFESGATHILTLPPTASNTPPLTATGTTTGPTSPVYTATATLTLTVISSATPSSAFPPSSPTLSLKQMATATPAWNCQGDLYNCSDFSACAQVMDYFLACPGDPSRLDRDHDGVPCESLCGG